MKHSVRVIDAEEYDEALRNRPQDCPLALMGDYRCVIKNVRLYLHGNCKYAYIKKRQRDDIAGASTKSLTVIS